MAEFNLWKGQWRFPSNDYGQIYGIHDTGVETFRGTPIKSLAREICQNSVDAALDPAKPVRVEFHLFDVSRSEIPQMEQLTDVFKRSREFWKDNAETAALFDSALKAAGKNRIRCLRISDFNTTGLTGSDKDYGTPWCNLTKSTGSSDKTGTSGGSFGIGKFAPFACSNFRTVFYSTLDKDGVKAQQGVARLTTFEDADGKKTQGTGFYGREKNLPLMEQLFLDPSFTRKDGESGTDIYIISYNAGDGWEKDMAASVLDGFLYAVYKGKLTVRLGEIEISRETLPNLMTKYKELFKEHADQYYQVLRADEQTAPKRECSFGDMGKATLRLLIAPGLWHRVAVVRETGMKIMDRGYINNIIPFAGVMYIEGTELNTKLRALENPQHTKWEIARASNKSEARGLTKKLFDFMKECFNEQKKQDAGGEIDPSVGEYLAAEEEGGQQDLQESLSDTIKSVDIRKRPILPPAGESSIPDTDSGNPSHKEDPFGTDTASDVPGSGESMGGGENFGTGHGGSAQGGGIGPNPVPHTKSVVFVKPEKRHIFCTDRKSGTYTVVYTPKFSAENGFMELFIAAESQNYDADIAAVTSDDGTVLKFSKNRIQGLTFEVGKPVKLSVRLNHMADYCSMEVKAYGNKI